MRWKKRGLAACVASLGLLALGHEASAQQQQNGNGSGYNWNGLYGGGNLGGAFGGSDFLSGLGSGVPFLEGQTYPTPPFNPATPAIIAAYRSNDVNIKSLTGGFQGGYNFWTGGVLIGVELDINFLNAANGKTTTAYGSTLFAPNPTLYTFRNEIDASYIFSARPRIGVPIGGAMFYGTGGVAVTTLRYNHSFTGTGGFFDGLSETASVSETKVGWTAGGGVELPLSANMTFKTEYLFTDFGSITTNGNKIFSPPGFSPDLACGADTGQAAKFGLAGSTPRQCFDHKANLVLHTLRMGLNFKF